MRAQAVAQACQDRSEQLAHDLQSRFLSRRVPVLGHAYGIFRDMLYNEIQGAPGPTPWTRATSTVVAMLVATLCLKLQRQCYAELQWLRRMSCARSRVPRLSAVEDDAHHARLPRTVDRAHRSGAAAL